MNCVNHSDREQVAFCQQCGRPVCAECVRRTGSAVFCTGCWPPRATTPPPAGFAGYPPAGYSQTGNSQMGAGGYGPVYPPPDAGEPSPGLAALLGFIPGVGAMYNGQYAKGIAHLIVFAGLVALADQNDFFGIFVAGWIFYMVIEAYHTASARRDGRPLPDPFGLNQIPDWLGFGKTGQGFGQRSTPPAATTGPDGSANSGAPDASAGNPYASSSSAPPSFPDSNFNDSRVSSMPSSSTPYVPYYRRFPTGAVFLILLGAFFLLNNMGLFHFIHARFFMPILLIGFGVWIFVHKMIDSGLSLENDGTDFYRWRIARAAGSSFWMVLIGVIWLLDALRILSWSHSWPLFLIAAGVMHLFRHALTGDYGGYPHSTAGYGGQTDYRGQPNGVSATPPTEAGAELAPSGRSAHDAPHNESHDNLHDDREGR